MPQLTGNTNEAFSGPSEITIEGVKYDVRTRVVYENSGRTGTIDTEKPIQYEFQYKEKPSIGRVENILPGEGWIPLATRSNDKSKNNGWVFTQAAGPGFKKALIEKGPNTLTTSMDNAAQNALAKDANVPVARAQQALGAAPNKALPTVAANQNPNAASGGPNQAQSAAQDAEKDLKDLREGTRYKKGEFREDLKYPENLQIEHQDVIEFNMLTYEKRSFSEGGTNNLGSFNERSAYTSRIIGKAILPIPGGISDTNAVTWGSDSLPAAKKALADFANSIITGGAESGANTAERKAEQASASSTEIQQGVAAYFTEQAIGASNILSRTQGAVQNPNMELLFSGPSLRPFSFTFKLSARGTKDRDQIRQIIRFFKQGMAVQRTASQLFLKAPNTFKIRYLHKAKDHPYINYIKECALQSFTVNYTPEGNYMTFADGLMTSYEISMQFQELEPIFNDDYSKLDKNEDTVIGY